MEDEELPTLEQDLAAIKQRAAEQKALAALPPQLGAGGANPMASRVQGAAESLVDSPLGKVGDALESTVQWVKNIPRNFGLGTLDAMVNTAKAPFDLATSVNAGFDDKDPIFGSQRTPGEIRNDEPHMADLTDQQQRLAAEIEPGRDSVSESFAVYGAWRESLRDDDAMSDQLTRGFAQFAVPFTAYAKAMGAARGAGWMQNVVAGVAADAAASGTAFDPHAGRMTNLIELGRHSEGRFGDALRLAAPDGGLINQYIDWMNTQDDEGELEGRFKNAVDGVVTSAALATFVKTAASTFKAARRLPEELAKPGKSRRERQRGHLKLELEPSEPRVASLGNVADEHTGSVLDGEFVVPGSQIITVKSKGKPSGFIAFNDLDENTLQINRAKVADDQRGTGVGKQLLLQALEYAQRRGKSLVSDNTVTVAQLHVYESLQRAGKIKVQYADPDAVAAALKGKDPRVPVKGPKGKPVVTSVELVRSE